MIRGRLVRPTLGAEPGAHAPRFPAIEGVRAFAALAIVAFHVGELGVTQGPLARFGQRLTVGVPVFFVVSAFVLYRPFVARRVAGEGTPAIGAFLLRRVARIVPLYWLTLTVVWLTSPTFSAQTREQFLAGVPWWRYYVFTQVYEDASSIAALGPAWSLNVEMAFYLALPFWALGAAWLVRRGTPVHLELACLGLVAAAALTHLHHLESTGSFLAKAPPANAGFFAIGMALAILSVDLGPSSRPLYLARAARAVVPLAAPAVAVILASFLLVEDIPRFHLVRIALVSLVLLPAAFDERPRTVARRILLQRHVQLIGVLSYGVYLFHRQIALALRLWLWTPMTKVDFAVALAAVTGLTVLLARVSYQHLEQPIIRLARSARRSTADRPEAGAPAP